MKAKFLFISLCLIVGITLSTVNAQNRAYQGWFQSTYFSPVFCDGVMVDYLEGGTLRVHYVYQYQPNHMPAYREIDMLKGEVTSSLPPYETFKIKEIDKIYFNEGWQCECKYNLIGNMGSHYIGTVFFTWTWFPPDEDHPNGHYEWVFSGLGKTVCN